MNIEKDFKSTTIETIIIWFQLLRRTILIALTRSKNTKNTNFQFFNAFHSDHYGQNRIWGLLTEPRKLKTPRLCSKKKTDVSVF